MEGFTDGNGALVILRNGIPRNMVCPHSGKFCNNFCPMFGSVRMIPKTTSPKKGSKAKPITTKTYHLDLCKKTIVFRQFTDES